MQHQRLVLASLAAVAEYPCAVAIHPNEAAVLRSVPRQAHIAAVAGGIDQFWTSAIAASVDSGQIRSDLSPRLLRRLLRDAVWLSPRWYRPSPDYPPAIAHGRVAHGLPRGLLRQGRAAPDGPGG
jgi:hypothetical protein